MVHNRIALSDEEDLDAAGTLAPPGPRKTNPSTSSVNTVAQRRPAVLDPAAALEDMQVQNYNLLNQIKELQRQVSAGVVDNRKRRKASKESEDLPESIAQYDGEISKNGRMYSLMICPWIEINVFENLKTCQKVDPLSEARYKDAVSMLGGTITELYEFLPKPLHTLMEKHSHFVSMFRGAVQGARSNAILAVRQKAGYIFSTNQEYFDTTFNRATIPALQAMLKFPNDKTYKALAPVLFADFRQDPSMKNLFKNMILVRIGRTILFGKSLSTKSKPQTLAEKWKVTESTPGLIAFCAILARFMVSPDSELRLVGPTTKINWLSDFHEYKKVLSTNSKKVREIFVFFDKHVFSSVNATAKLVDVAADDKEELEDAWNALAYDSDPADLEPQDHDVEMDICLNTTKDSRSSQSSGAVFSSSSLTGTSTGTISIDKDDEQRSTNRGVRNGSTLFTKAPPRRAVSPDSEDSFGFTEAEKCARREQEAVAQLRKIKLTDYARHAEPDESYLEGSQNPYALEALPVRKVKKAPYKKTAPLDLEDFSEAINFEVQEHSEIDDDLTEAHVVKTKGINPKKALPYVAVDPDSTDSEDIQQYSDMNSDKRMAFESQAYDANNYGSAAIQSKSKVRNSKISAKDVLLNPTPVNTEVEDFSDVASRASENRKNSLQTPGSDNEETSLRVNTQRDAAAASKLLSTQAKTKSSVRSKIAPIATDEVTHAAPSSKRLTTKQTSSSVSSSLADTDIDESAPNATAAAAEHELQEQRTGGTKSKVSKKKAYVAAVEGTRRSGRNTAQKSSGLDATDN